MKQILIYILSILACTATHAYTISHDADYWLDVLDHSLDQRDQYDRQRTDAIDQLKQQLRQGRGDAFELNYALSQQYMSYCYDSARHYSLECLAIARQQQRDDRHLVAVHALAYSLISAGLLSEADELLAGVDRRQLSGPLLAEHYSHLAQLWRTRADYIGQEPYYTQYIDRSNAYLDSLLGVTPAQSMMWWSVTGSKLMRLNQYQQALEAFGHVLANDSIDADIHLLAITTAEMAWAYIYMDNEPKAIEYFARSAVADNESATREITALYHLSRLVDKYGQHDRASRYVHQALEDINFYNTRLRKEEISDILPIIEQDRYDALRAQRNWLFAATALAIALLVYILFSYRFIRSKNRQLTEAHRTIAGQLEELRQANLQLKEADKIKNAYIGRSFYTNAEFVAKLEKLFLALDRKIATRQYDDLRSTLKQSTLNAERESMFEAFDQTFLKLFPDFVARYNALFEPKDRRQPATEQSLTSEMRIFALIRLGITDSERIAKFLDYSVHTVNTYKTRIKNRSTAENDQFERLIMEI